MNSGYRDAHSHVCMPPIDVPITSRRWFTFRPSVSRRCSRLDHVDVAVAREPCAQAVARLARVAVADVVRQDDVVLRGVEQLAWAEQLAGEAVAEELRPLPVVPCMIKTALRTMPCASLRGVPSVR